MGSRGTLLGRLALPRKNLARFMLRGLCAVWFENAERRRKSRKEKKAVFFQTPIEKTLLTSRDLA